MGKKQTALDFDILRPYVIIYNDVADIFLVISGSLSNVIFFLR